IPASELVPARYPCSAVGSSRRTRPLEAYGGFHLYPRPRPGRPIQGPLPSAKPRRVGETHPLVEETRLRCLCLFRQRSKKRRSGCRGQAQANTELTASSPRAANGVLFLSLSLALPRFANVLAFGIALFFLAFIDKPIVTDHLPEDLLGAPFGLFSQPA